MRTRPRIIIFTYKAINANFAHAFCFSNEAISVHVDKDLTGGPHIDHGISSDYPLIF